MLYVIKEVSDVEKNHHEVHNVESPGMELCYAAELSQACPGVSCWHRDRQGTMALALQSSPHVKVRTRARPRVMLVRKAAVARGAVAVTVLARTAMTVAAVTRAAKAMMIAKVVMAGLMRAVAMEAKVAKSRTRI